MRIMRPSTANTCFDDRGLAKSRNLILLKTPLNLDNPSIRKIIKIINNTINTPIHQSFQNIENAYIPQSTSKYLSTAPKKLIHREKFLTQKNIQLPSSHPSNNQYQYKNASFMRDLFEEDRFIPYFQQANFKTEKYISSNQKLQKRGHLEPKRKNTEIKVKQMKRQFFGELTCWQNEENKNNLEKLFD